MNVTLKLHYFIYQLCMCLSIVSAPQQFAKQVQNWP